MLPGVRSTPFSVAEFPFSPPFSKQNGGELAVGMVPKRPMESVFRRTLAAPGLSERCGKQSPHSSQISDFLRASRKESRPPQPRAGTRARLTRIRHPLDAVCLKRGCLSSGNADRSASVGFRCNAFLHTWRQPSHA